MIEDINPLTAKSTKVYTKNTKVSGIQFAAFIIKRVKETSAIFAVNFATSAVKKELEELSR